MTRCRLCCPSIPALLAACAGPTLARAASPYRVQPIGPPVTAVDVYSEPAAINDAGQVLGGLYIGPSASPWLHDPRTDTYRFLGLTDAVHTAADGTVANVPDLLGTTGVVAGTAARYLGGPSSSAFGRDAWVDDPATGPTRMIGLADAAHTAADGTRTNDVVALNAAGQVVGNTVKVNTGYTGTTYDAWLYSPGLGATRSIGLTDAAHTPAAGGSNNQVVGLNAAGQVIGTARSASGRYGPYADGTDAWVYTPATNAYRTLGLVDAAHQGGYGPTHTPVAINTAGQVVGTSQQTGDGSDTWVDLNDGRPARLIGPTDALHTANGGRSNSPVGLADTGRVAGWSQRYGPGFSDLGRDAWTYDPATDRTTVIGLTDADHTSYGGTVYNDPTFVNRTGEVAGYAKRYFAGGQPYGGSDLWLFDPATDATTRLDLPDNWEANLGGLNDAGEVVGHYTATDDQGRDTNGLYAWTLAGGVVALPLPSGYPAAADYAPALVNNTGQVAGAVALAGPHGSATAAFLFTPVPEPTATVLLAAAAALGRRRARRRDPGRIRPRSLA